MVSNNKQLKICFIGKMRSGKSKAVDYVISTRKAEKVDFGDKLKEVVNMLYPNLDKQTKNRKLLQGIGQHMRMYDESIWLRPVDKIITESDKDIIVCASCRQDNEYNFLKQHGFKFVKIDCKDSLRVKRAEDSGDDFSLMDFMHETELQVDNFKVDYVITNEDSIEFLENEIENILKMEGK